MNDEGTSILVSAQTAWICGEGGMDLGMRALDGMGLGAGMALWISRVGKGMLLRLL